MFNDGVDGLMGLYRAHRPMMPGLSGKVRIALRPKPDTAWGWLGDALLTLEATLFYPLVCKFLSCYSRVRSVCYDCK